MTNKKKSLNEALNVNRSKKKYRVRLAETKEAENEIKEFDRYENIPDNENRKTNRRTY